MSAQVMTVELKVAPQVYVFGVLLPEKAVGFDQSAITPDRLGLRIYTARLDDRFEVKKLLQKLIYDHFHPTGWNYSMPQPESFAVDIPVRVLTAIPIPLPGIGALPVITEATVSEVLLAVEPKAS